MSEFEDLSVAVDGAVGRLQLDRPERLNALSARTLQELIAAARWFDDQQAVKVVTVSGSGRAFSAGFDLGALSAPDPDTPTREVADLGRAMADAISGMRAITIAAIQGRCVGGGLVLAAACDLRVATTDCIFSIPEADLGIPLAWGGIPRLVREIGPALTKELVLTCREFGADEAAAAGLLNRVVAVDELDSAVDELARQLAEKPHLVLSVTKRHVNAVAEEMATTAHGRRDADVMVAALNDPESQAAAAAYLQAFLAKRQ